MLLDGHTFIDLLYLPALALAVDIGRARNSPNYQVPAMLLGLAVLNGLYHYYDPTLALRAAVLLIVALITLIGGRIIPAFTQNALRLEGGLQVTCRTPRALDLLAVPSVVLVLMLEMVSATGPASGIASMTAALILGARMLGWRSLATWRLPLVWILHIGYLWVPIGFLLNGIAQLGGPVDQSQVLHVFTVGAIGTMILAVASRAALGHSGRPLQAGPWTIIAYLLVIAATLVRICLASADAMVIAGTLWTLGYGVFAVTYWPVLTKPRIDGLPG